MAHQGQHVPGPDTLEYKHVYYSGTDTIKTGYALCYDYDNITGAAATLANNNRVSIAEKPAAHNIRFFAGVVAPGYPAAGVTGPGIIRVVRPNGKVCNVFTDQYPTLGYTILYVQSGTYYLTDAAYASSTANCRPVALALQTIDRSTNAGLCQAKLDDHIVPWAGLGIASGSYLVAEDGVTSGTLYGTGLCLKCETVGGGFSVIRLRGEITGAGANMSWGALCCQAVVNCASAEETSGYGATAVNACTMFKTGNTPASGQYQGLLAGIENQDGTPATVTGIQCYAAAFRLNMNTSAPSTLAQLHFASDGTADPDYFFVAKGADAVKFEAVTLAQPDHGLKIQVAGVNYWIVCVDHQTT